jgi:hypothetical protein
MREDENQSRRLYFVVIVDDVDFGRDVLDQGASVRTCQSVTFITLDTRDGSIVQLILAFSIVVFSRDTLVTKFWAFEATFIRANWYWDNWDDSSGKNECILLDEREPWETSVTIMAFKTGTRSATPVTIQTILVGEVSLFVNTNSLTVIANLVVVVQIAG